MPSRDVAVRKMLKRTKDELTALCHWCGTLCIWSQKMPKEIILNPTTMNRDGNRTFKFPNGNLKFTLQGQELELPIVTVDHVLEISKGGTNKSSNLVLACFKCNSTRSTPPNPDRHASSVCVQCGDPKSRPSQKRCNQCIETNKAFHLRNKELTKPEASGII